MKNIVLKAASNNQKDRQKMFRNISKLQGIKDVSFDLEKGTLSVTGDMDPLCVGLLLKKCGRGVEIVSVGPPPKPKTGDKKEDGEKGGKKKGGKEKGGKEKGDKNPSPPQCVCHCPLYYPPPCPPYPPYWRGFCLW